MCTAYQCSFFEFPCQSGRSVGIKLREGHRSVTHQLVLWRLLHTCISKSLGISNGCGMDSIIHVLVLKARHLTFSAFCWVDIGLPEQALGWFPQARFGIGYGR